MSAVNYSYNNPGQFSTKQQLRASYIHVLVAPWQGEGQKRQLLSLNFSLSGKFSSKNKKFETESPLILGDVGAKLKF